MLSREKQKVKFSSLEFYNIIISALAGLFLKSQNVYLFFFSTILGTILNNSDILFGSDYKRKN